MFLSLECTAKRAFRLYSANKVEEWHIRFPSGKLKVGVGHLEILAPVDLSSLILYIKPHLQNINSILSTMRVLCNQY